MASSRRGRLGAAAGTEHAVALNVRPGEFAGTRERARHQGAFDIRALAVRPEGQEIGLHSHADAHFFLVLSGRYLSSAQGAPEVAAAPFLVFDPPGTTHGDRFADDTGAFLAISLTAPVFAEACAAEALPGDACALPHPAALAAALRLAREIGGGVDAAALEASAWELVGAARPSERSRATPRWARTAYEAVMDEAADAALSVGRIAAQVGVHPVHLARVFRRAWGCTPGDLMRWRRLERSCELLERTRLPLAEIALSVGFVDQAHMTHAFRARYGWTPGQWRRARQVAPIQDEAPEAA